MLGQVVSDVIITDDMLNAGNLIQIETWIHVDFIIKFLVVVKWRNNNLKVTVDALIIISYIIFYLVFSVQPMPRGDHVLNFSDAEDMMDDSHLQ